MTRTARRPATALLALSASALALVAGTRGAAAADTPTQVVITDSGCPNAPPCYQPSQVSIPVNGSVTWTNQSSKDHTVTCTSAPPGVVCNGDSGGQGGGFGETSPIHHNGNDRTYSYQFTVPGTYLYHSKADSSSLVGEVDVQPSGPFTFAISPPAATSAPATPSPAAETPSDMPSASASASASSSASASASASATDTGPIGIAPARGGGSGFPVIPVVLIILLAAGAAGGAVYLNRRQ